MGMTKRLSVRFAVLSGVVLGAVALALASCGSRTDTAEDIATQEPAGRLALTVEGAATGAGGSRCVIDVTARNDTGAAALNVQVAWMAQTDGFGSISDYQVLGDFTVEETRPVQLGVFGAPCEAVKELKLTRAVCTVGPAGDPPKSCAELVVLDVTRLAERRASPP